MTFNPKVLSRLDEDADGVIKVDDVLKVIEMLGREHVKLSGKQINKIIDMLQKEEMLETESSIEKLMVKSPPDEDDEAVTREAMKDIAKDMTLQPPEEHIREMFDHNKQEQQKQKQTSKNGNSQTK